MTRKGGGAVCRPGRGATERRAGEGDWLGHHWSSECPQATHRCCPGRRCWAKQTWAGPSPSWAAAHQLVPQAGAPSQSRLVGYAGNTSAAAVLTCGAEEASGCYLSGEFLTPVWWEMLLQPGEPASPGSIKTRFSGCLGCAHLVQSSLLLEKKKKRQRTSSCPNISRNAYKMLFSCTGLFILIQFPL